MILKLRQAACQMTFGLMVRASHFVADAKRDRIFRKLVALWKHVKCEQAGCSVCQQFTLGSLLVRRSDADDWQVLPHGLFALVMLLAAVVLILVLTS